jgi:hypothetical protein
MIVKKKEQRKKESEQHYHLRDNAKRISAHCKNLDNILHKKEIRE